MREKKNTKKANKQEIEKDRIVLKPYLLKNR